MFCDATKTKIQLRMEVDSGVVPTCLIYSSFLGSVLLKDFWYRYLADLEKVINRPQAENSELYDVLKIMSFATMDEQKYMY